MAESKVDAEALIPRFTFERILNQGAIEGVPALLLLERAAFPSDASEVRSLLASITDTANLGANDIYRWYMANTASSPTQSNPPQGPASAPSPSPSASPSLKINLIYPCTAAHIKKYTPSRLRLVTETPTIYTTATLPYLRSLRSAGKLNWIFNVLDGRTEQEDVILRHRDPVEGFLLLPDLNWDRRTLAALHLLALVERRDLWSLRDLTKGHVAWLTRMRAALLQATTKCYPAVEADELKLYVHYQPTYAHFHIHIVHVATTSEAGATQAVGKAFGLENIISQLETMAGGDDAGMKDVSLAYFVGENSDVWERIWGPLKRGEVVPSMELE